MLQEREVEIISYRVVDEKENPAESVIQKTGMVAEFTLGDINRDLMLLAKKKDELESQIAVEDARCKNIDRTNPEIGEMSEEMRQIIFIYERAFAFVKIARQKVEEIKAQEKSYREEVIKIQMETGMDLTPKSTPTNE